MPKKKITRTRQCLCGSAICLHPRICRYFTIIRENTKCGYSFHTHFQDYQKRKKKNPNHQKWFLHPAHRFLHLPLHGLSLSKSPIKKPHNIIRVGLGRQPDQTQLGSTKAQQTMPRSMGFMVKGEKCRGTYYYFYGFFLLCF